MNQTSEPQFDAPGAGLPPIELFVGRILFSLRCAVTSRERASAYFQREREAIRALVARCDPEAGTERVLISRGRGMEDSSRYWSVWMTLDHLRIVNESMAGVIRALTNGVMPEGKASTATVKPSPTASAEVITGYEQACDVVLAGAAEARDLHTPLRYAHPWFGPLDAAGWHTLAGGHMGIHRRQIEQILVGLDTVRRGGASQESAG